MCKTTYIQNWLWRPGYPVLYYIANYFFNCKWTTGISYTVVTWPKLQGLFNSRQWFQVKTSEINMVHLLYIPF